METTTSLPLEVKEISKKMKIVERKKGIQGSGGWDEIIGKVRVGRKILVEELIKGKGIEDAS